MKRYLFFLNHYNDIDNIAPAIYFYLEADGNHRADIVLYSREYDFRNNPNLLLLKERFGNRFSYEWLGYYFGLNFDDHLKRLKRSKTTWFRAKRYVLRKLGVGDVEFNVDAIRTGKVPQECINRGLRRILEERSPANLVVFESNRSSHYAGLLKGLRACGIERIVCLANSAQINYNVLKEVDFVDVFSDDFRMKHDYSGIDAFGLTEHYLADSYNGLFPLLGFPSHLKGRTTYLGAIRYCPEWMKIRAIMTKPFERNTDKIKLVFFLSAPKGNVNWEEVERTFQLLSLFPDYDVVVKNHTRHPSRKRERKYSNITFIENVESPALIDWADAVLFWGTSAAIEGYMKGKTMVCLKHLVANKNVYAEYNAGVVTQCRDDLLTFLVLYRSNRNAIPYDKEGAAKLVREVVVPNGESVPQRYLRFMQENEMSRSSGEAVPGHGAGCSL